MAESLVAPVLRLMLFVCSVLAASGRLHGVNRSQQGRPPSSASNYSICANMVRPWGYACEEHTVTTKDGYILGVQRIPAHEPGQRMSKAPVLLQHGLLMDAVTWVYNQPDKSLAFILADNGYDVWMANSRGTKPSLGHTSLSSSDPAYWEWTWDELVSYDLTATFQHVNRVTGQNLHYVAHSLGTLMGLAAFSQNKLVNMMRSAVLLSPIAYLNNIPSMFARATANMFVGEELYWLGLHEFNLKGEAADALLNTLCKISTSLCGDLLNGFTGQNCCLNSSRAGIFFEYEPQPTSTKNMVHIAQMIRTGTIRKFDYGGTGNMNHYAQPTPPVYDMSSIPADLPLYVAYGGRDMLAGVKDVHALLNKLESHDVDKLVTQYVAEYAHADFVFGVNAHDRIYDPVLAFFKLN
ncbi:hypothetical protein MLD38_003030 [Melastoma candidum]|uniref:Uncharacterized protein n=1 Tax=Melastoma candidum TaxID=119954 RepID=A0ACB9S2M0_9MYRT|nr:hypothetical protein MLD38_003030 [Melastoma candidum]